MNRSGAVYLLGHAMVDVTLATAEPIKLRLGGILHAARALWAMDIPYSLAYMAPIYLSADIDKYARHHGADEVRQVGVVTGAPNVILINDATEAGNQGYELLLREHQKTQLQLAVLREIAGNSHVTDVFVFPGGFDLSAVLRVFRKSKARIHIDLAYGVKRIEELKALGRSFDVISVSTSSDLFLKQYAGQVEELYSALLKSFSNSVLFKENRGGARLFKSDSSLPLRAPAQLRPVVHSVGVGDCYDVVFGLQRRTFSDESSLAYASYIAAEYAATTFPDDFKREVKRALALPAEVITALDGVSLPWEDRPLRQIYIAAPDFDFMDTAPIDSVCAALRYHNFRPRLPVREHGQMGADATTGEKIDLCTADLALMDECHMLVAVLISNDPGTLIEIGLAVQRGMQVVVYDPYERAENLMLTQLPELVSSSLESVISQVFLILSRN